MRQIAIPARNDRSHRQFGLKMSMIAEASDIREHFKIEREHFRG
jgi:hypothetical protein